ncbi:MAG: SIR2 family protein [Bacteroidetes bacterium]|nr:SIR2 family protein [Bacteroidota bacterium]
MIQGFNIMLSDSNDNEKAVKMRDEWAQILNQELQSFIKKIIETEERIRSGFERFDEKGQQAQRLLLSFLLSFGSRPPSRERLHIFTTNYDRLIEYGADLVGLRIMDRFVGSLEPVFRASRLGIDMHYNPPGIRGEPRILEGVIRFTKLHGSIDWVNDSMPNQPYHVLQRCLPFGKISCFSEKPVNPVDRLMIYPNSAKDMETLIYPYAELFRDFATAVCQSNTVLFTYGYGFGDDHINRVIRDMLTIPSTHLVMISYDDADGRISKFYNTALSESQISLLVGPHFGDLSTLVDNYLPQPQIEQVKWKMAQLIKNRSVINNNEQANTSETEEA